MSLRRECQRWVNAIHFFIGSVLLSCLFLSLCLSSCSPTKEGIEYVNPRVYDVDFTFELRPDPGTIDREKDPNCGFPCRGSGILRER
jgi:hypothetical protein